MNILKLRQIIKEELKKAVLKETTGKYTPYSFAPDFYTPYSFAPDLSSLNRKENDIVMNDLRGNRMGLVDYLQFANSMSSDPTYKSIFLKLFRSNENKLNFLADQDEIMKYKGEFGINGYLKFMDFYNKWKNIFPDWAYSNKEIYNNIKSHIEPSLND